MPGTKSARRSGGRQVVIAAAGVAASCIVAAGLTGSAAGQDPPPRPNVVVVMTDDQPASLLNRATMPRTMRLLAGRGVGTRFSHAYVSSPLCCPARAGFLT